MERLYHCTLAMIPWTTNILMILILQSFYIVFFLEKSLVENVAVNKKNTQTVVKKEHVPVMHVYEMHGLGSSQQIALITDTHVLIVVLSAMWAYFLCALFYTHPIEDCCCIRIVT